MKTRVTHNVKHYKKTLVVLVVLLAGLALPICAKGQEHWLFTGFDYDFTFFTSPTDDLEKILDDNDTNSLGFDVSWYGFLGKESSVGMYASLGFLFPIDNNKSTEQVVSPEPQSPDYRKRDFIFSVLLGPAFRFQCTDTLAMYLGVGLSFSHHTVSETSGMKTTTAGLTSLGCGLDTGFKFNITERVCFRIGASGSYEFATMYTESISEKGGSSNPTDSRMRVVNSFSITPYVGMGIVLSSAKTQEVPRTISLASMASSR